MKRCMNPDCVAYQEGRIFQPEDRICPRCHEPLVTVDADGNPVDPILPPRPAPAPAIAQWLLAVLTLLGMIALAFGCAFVLGGLRLGSGPSASPTAVGLAPGDATATTEAALVMLTSTPIVLPTEPGSPANVAENAPTATAVAGTNSNGIVPATVGSSAPDQTNSGASPYVIPGVSEVRLCQRLAAGATCDPVLTYSTTASFYVAVRAGFGPGGATTAQARLYGPDGTLLHTTDPLTPNRTGTYWVGFTFSQSVPWRPGNYQAEIDLDGINMRQVTIPVAP